MLIQINTSDARAKKDAIVNFGGNMLGDGSVMINSVADLTRYATFEPDFWRLNGEFTIAGNTIGHFYSAGLSNASREFATVPYLTINVGAYPGGTYPYNFRGMTFQMGDEYCTDMHIKWLDYENNILAEKSITGNTEKNIYIGDSVDEVIYILIEFLKTKKPYRFARLDNIEIGEIIVLDDDRITEADVLEESDLLATSTPAGVLNFSALNELDEIDIVNPSGAYGNLRENLPVLVFDDMMNNAGVYLLSDWKKQSDSVYSFSAVDMIGKYRNRDYIGSAMLNNAALNAIVSDIFNAADEKITIAPALQAYQLNGYIPNTDKISALQSALINAGGYVYVDRKGVMQIARPFISDASAPTFYYENMLGDLKIEQTQKIDGAKIDFYSIALGTQETRTTPQIMVYGYYKYIDIDLTQFGYSYFLPSRVAVNPASTASVDVSGAIFTVDGIKKVLIASNGSLILNITGNPVTTNKSTYAIPASAGKTASLSENRLINSQATASTVGNRLIQYYGKRLKLSFKSEYSEVHIGQYVKVVDKHGNTIGGNITKLKTDLAGGMLQEIEVLGNVI